MSCYRSAISSVVAKNVDVVVVIGSVLDSPVCLYLPLDVDEVAMLSAVGKSPRSSMKLAVMPCDPRRQGSSIDHRLAVADKSPTSWAGPARS